MEVTPTKKNKATTEETSSTPGHRTLRDWVLIIVARRTSSGRYLPEIDGLRSVAILLVILYHLQAFINGQQAYMHPFTPAEEFFRTLINCGSFGVQVFFAISGFIIALPFVDYFSTGTKPVKLKDFYLRRITRLEPPYIINMLVNSVIKAAADHMPLIVIAMHFFAGLIYSHNIIYGIHNNLNQALWSLEVEFQFYFLAPLFLLAFKIRRPLLRRFFLIAPIILLILLRPETWRVDKSLLGKAEFFFVGILLTDIYVNSWKSIIPRKRHFDFIAGIGWLSFFYCIYLPNTKITLLFRPLFLFLAFVGSIGGGFFSSIFCNPWISAFGGMCYTVYLYHSNIISVVIRLTKSYTVSSSYFMTYFTQLVINLIPIILISTLLFILLEKPFMKKDWPKHLWRRFSSRPGSIPLHPTTSATDSSHTLKP